MRVGRTVRVLEDLDRNETFIRTDNNRKVIISVFYPVDRGWNAPKQALYIDLYKPMEKRFIDEWKEAGVNENYICSITTKIYLDSPISNKHTKYPVIIYSPGFSCDRDSSTFSAQKLAEEGYIVITLGHIYETDYTIMPDGKVIEISQDLRNISSNSKEIWKMLIDIRKQDIIYLLNVLDYINNHDESLRGKLDTQKVGVIGFSLGSQACFEAAADDKRIKAVALFEGCLHNSTVSERVESGERTNTPHLLLKRHAASQRLRVEECISWYKDMEDREEAEKRIKEEVETALMITKTQKNLYEYVNGFKSFVKLNYSKHMTFSDIPILQNKQYEECFGGKLSIKMAHKIINTVTVKFFNEFLSSSVNEYNNFISCENHYSELVRIDADGEII